MSGLALPGRWALRGTVPARPPNGARPDIPAPGPSGSLEMGSLGRELSEMSGKPGFVSKDGIPVNDSFGLSLI